MTHALPHIYMAELNLTVGGIAGNVVQIAAAYETACAEGADLVVCPEMCLIGYPPEDLIFTPSLQQAAIDAVADVAALTAGEGKPALLIGGIWREGENLYNTGFLLDGGTVVVRQYKHHLPNYGVFDEKRIFAEGPLPDAVNWRGWRLGLMNCEDMWGGAVAPHLAAQGIDLFVTFHASPFELDKPERRAALAQSVFDAHGIPLVYVNQRGGQDELVFDGGSFRIDAEGMHYLHPLPEPNARLYEAMKMGLRDYVQKNGFSGVLLGLSGGIDSALTAVVAADALGADKVHCVMLPSPYTSQMSLDDAAELAANLGVRLDTIPIENCRQSVHDALMPAVPPSALAEENIQSRLRGLLLMSISNTTGALLVTTGNKSELAVGYATLYGDMCGAYSVLKDLYKTKVFALSRWRNRQGAAPVMPERIITRPPSAELREDQKDEDSLPPYDVLDVILYDLIEGKKSVAQVVAAHGFAEETVQHIATLLYRNEYKRRQAPPGVKLSKMSFGRDRRFPLTNRFVL